MASYIQRYQQGDCEQVWDELLSLGNQVRHEPLFSEAQAVAYATMERVQKNLGVLIPRLQALGYIFGLVPPADEEAGEGESLPVYVSPSSNTRDLVNQLEQAVGPLPLSIRAFYEVVGGVNLMGKHPQWESYLSFGLDPLVVWSLDESLVEWCISEYHEESACWYLTIAPDSSFKEGVEGDGAYEIALPNAAVDAPLLWEWHNTTFVNYLRIALQWGGFPGFARTMLPPTKDLAYLTEGLLPI
jgi:hypothetical protein